MTPNELVRFMAKVQKQSNDGCWLWTGAKNRQGYGYIRRHSPRRMQRAHQASYEHFVSAIPKGLVLNHTCRVIHCVNPHHLQPITQKENIQRAWKLGNGYIGQQKMQRYWQDFNAKGLKRTFKTREPRETCMRGHPMSGDNLRTLPNGKRVCRCCHNLRELRSRKSLPNRRLNHAISRQVRQMLNGRKAGIRWQDILGYSVDDLREHLERQFRKGMRWDNYGSAWHIDHITPVSRFHITGPHCQELKACWALSNLRPLRKKVNLSKGSKRTHLL